MMISIFTNIYIVMGICTVSYTTHSWRSHAIKHIYTVVVEEWREEDVVVGPVLVP